jgi:hypothetical protein
MPTKLDLLLIVACLVTMVCWMERSHSVVIDGAFWPVVAAQPACLGSQSRRYAANRMLFLDGGFVSGVRRPVEPAINTTSQSC